MTVGFLTLDVGEQVLIYNKDGEAKIKSGPNRLFLWRERYTFLRVFRANQNQYLVIKYLSGKVEHKDGPCSVFLNPLIHSGIYTNEAISLDANELLVVYSQNQKTDDTAQYRLQYGPHIFIPKDNEWIHQFKWHGTDPDNKTRMLPGAHSFTKLRCIPDQFYYNVDEVRTSDDALLRIKLMCFYQLKDVEIMLKMTHDPIADFINCLCADVVTFVAGLSYMEFIKDADKLNEKSSYPLLMERSKRIGFEISKVVYRGYYASPVLQSMHDQAIQTRNRLKLAFETEQQKQQMIDEQMQCEKERINAEQELEIQKLKNKHELERQAKIQQLQLVKQKEEYKIEQAKERELAELNFNEQDQRQEVERYRELHKFGVDLTQYILSKNPRPSKLVQIVTGDTSANFHLHQN